MIYHSREFRSGRARNAPSKTMGSTSNADVRSKADAIRRRSFLISSLILALAILCVSSRRQAMMAAINDASRHIQGVTTLQEYQDSAFETEMYHHLQEPYVAYPCFPRKLHVAQASNVDADTNLVNMTLSFTIDYEQCENMVPIITYGRGLFSEGTTIKVIEPTAQFLFDSAVTGEKYQSDWIYHVTIPNVIAGEIKYWYRIVVHKQQPQQLSTIGDQTSSSSPKRYAARKQQQQPITTNMAFVPPTCTATLFSLRRSRRKQLVMGETTTLSFVTPPFVGTSTTLALVGDLGQTNNSTKTMNHILQSTPNWWSPFLNEKPITAVLLAGDVSYADGAPRRWDRWFDLMEPLLRTTTLQVAPGNHEIECDNTTHGIFIPYENFFRNPNRVGPPDMLPVDDEYRKTLWNKSCQTPSSFAGHYNYGNAFYSFIHGLVHVVVLNSYTDSTIGSIQYDWLEQTLEIEVDRSVTPWLLVMFHCPLHTTFIGHVDGTNQVEMLKNMEPLFVQYQVNIIVSGHDHAFMRTYPMIGNELDPTGKGPIYLTLGAGGNREQHTAGFIHKHQEPWVAKRDNDEYGFGKLFVANATHARFRWVRDGTTRAGVQDDVWLENQLFVDE